MSKDFGFDTSVADTTNGEFYCKVCDTSANSKDMWASHIAGKKHIRRVAKGPLAMYKRHERRKKDAAAGGGGDDDDYDMPSNMDRFDDKSNSYGWEPQDFPHRDHENEYYEGQWQDRHLPEWRHPFITDETDPLYNSESRGSFSNNMPDASEMYVNSVRQFEQDAAFKRRRDDMIAPEKPVDFGRYVDRRDLFGAQHNFPIENSEIDRYDWRFNERELNPRSSFPFDSEPERNSSNQRPHLPEFPTDSQKPSTSKSAFQENNSDSNLLLKVFNDAAVFQKLIDETFSQTVENKISVPTTPSNEVTAQQNIKIEITAQKNVKSESTIEQSVSSNTDALKKVIGNLFGQKGSDSVTSSLKNKIDTSLALKSINQQKGNRDSGDLHKVISDIIGTSITSTATTNQTVTSDAELDQIYNDSVKESSSADQRAFQNPPVHGRESSHSVSHQNVDPVSSQRVNDSAAPEKAYKNADTVSSQRVNDLAVLERAYNNVVAHQRANAASGSQQKLDPVAFQRLNEDMAILEIAYRNATHQRSDRDASSLQNVKSSLPAHQGNKNDPNPYNKNDDRVVQARDNNDPVPRKKFRDDPSPRKDSNYRYKDDSVSCRRGRDSYEKKRAEREARYRSRDGRVSPVKPSSNDRRDRGDDYKKRDQDRKPPVSIPEKNKRKSDLDKAKSPEPKKSSKENVKRKKKASSSSSSSSSSSTSSSSSSSSSDSDSDHRADVDSLLKSLRLKQMKMQSKRVNLLRKLNLVSSVENRMKNIVDKPFSLEHTMKTSGKEKAPKWEELNPENLNPEDVDSLLSSYLKPQDNKESNAGPKVEAKKVETLHAKTFLQIVLKKMDGLDLKGMEELNLLVQIVAKAQALICKKMPPRIQAALMQKMSQGQNKPPQMPLAPTTPLPSPSIPTVPGYPVALGGVPHPASQMQLPVKPSNSAPSLAAYQQYVLAYYKNAGLLVTKNEGSLTTPGSFSPRAHQSQLPVSQATYIPSTLPTPTSQAIPSESKPITAVSQITSSSSKLSTPISQTISSSSRQFTPISTTTSSSSKQLTTISQATSSSSKLSKPNPEASSTLSKFLLQGNGLIPLSPHSRSSSYKSSSSASSNKLISSNPQRNSPTPSTPTSSQKIKFSLADTKHSSVKRDPSSLSSSKEWKDYFIN